MTIDLPVTQEILTEISRLDRFQGEWATRRRIPRGRLRRIEESARIQSVAASCRMAGIRVSDAEVAGLLSGQTVALRDTQDILGYAAAMERRLAAAGSLITSTDLRLMHATMMGVPDQAEPSLWRSAPLMREAFDSTGKATGRVFSTLPPRLIEETIEETLTWLEYELRAGEQHPVLVAAAFLVYFLAISPFEGGNGRMARLLAQKLLLRSGYTFIPYASLESQLESSRDGYHHALDRSQARIWRGDADLEPWLGYFLGQVAAHRSRVEQKIELERDVCDFPPLQQAILETVREHGTVDAALLLKATGANRNTLKDNLRRLVQSGVLERTGQRRGTRYLMATGAEPGT